MKNFKSIQKDGISIFHQTIMIHIFIKNIKYLKKIIFIKSMRNLLFILFLYTWCSIFSFSVNFIGYRLCSFILNLLRPGPFVTILPTIFIIFVWNLVIFSTKAKHFIMLFNISDSTDIEPWNKSERKYLNLIVLKVVH